MQYMGPAGDDTSAGGGGDDDDLDTGPEPDAARTFLADFVDADALKALDDTKVLEHHKRVSAAVAKHGKPADWPDDWRERYITKKGAKDADADKLKARLGRYASPEAALDGLFAAQQRISSGELRTTLPKDAKPEQVAQWRKDNGIPEKAGDYDLKFDSGLVIGAADKPTVDAFLARAHASNMHPDQVKQTVEWWHTERESQAAARQEADANVARSRIDTLRTEWGGEYRANQSRVQAALSMLPGEAAQRLMAARLADGTPVMSDPDILRGLVAIHREVNPTSTVVADNDPETMAATIDDEIKTIKGYMSAPKGTAEYRKYWGDEKAQARYRQLLDAKANMGKRSGRAKAA